MVWFSCPSKILNNLLGHFNSSHYFLLVPVHFVEGAKSILALRNHESALTITPTRLVWEPARLIVEGTRITVNPFDSRLTLLKQVSDHSSSLVLWLGESAV